jgi:hypothetical protein
MNRVAILMPSIAVLLVLWQECGENPALFCYRIGMGAFASVRVHARRPLRFRA